MLLSHQLHIHSMQVNTNKIKSVKRIHCTQAPIIFFKLSLLSNYHSLYEINTKAHYPPRSQSGFFGYHRNQNPIGFITR